MRRFACGVLGAGLLVLISLDSSSAFFPWPNTPPPKTDDSAQGRWNRLWQGMGNVDVTPTQESCDEMEYQLDGLDLSAVLKMDQDKAKDEIGKAFDCEWD